jgi:hypothetical protein
MSEIPKTVEKKEPNPTLIVLYILYKSNMISRRNLKQMLEIIKQPFPEELPKYLVTEADKSS